MKNTRSLPAGGRVIYFIKDLRDPLFKQVCGEQSMYLSR